MTKWEVGVEYGPTAADIHYIIVDANSSEDAKNCAQKWAATNKLNGMVSYIQQLTDEHYDDILEWTQEEEEAFLDIVNKNDTDKDL